ncbi:type IV pilus assembly protein PilM [Gryllotalpicola protaetiae]|uniref:Type IV pilus assembly protein PilM n=1 Tax=Gryllotalpicola protaetiae TaxID=2419771 RepID=A0A387BLV0_9MICO|nr:type IV pilus assembly protein PilM [Gryllotalpicola protaetiae]AYG03004.1 type IV pilus assembly protein PilM [Gryllotalpicola protaetiae]
MPTTIVGIDIGSETIRAVEITEPGKGRAVLHRFHELDLPVGAVVRGEVEQPHTVATALKQLWARGGFKSKKVVIGVGNQRVLARDLSVPKASIKQIRATLPFHVQDLLPVPVSDALLDFYPVSETVGESGPMVTGLLVAAVKEAVLGNVKAVQTAGLEPQNVDLIPFALVRSLIDRASGSGTVAVVDLGASATTVVVAARGVPQFIRIIPSGSDDLTRALAQRLEVAGDEAERVKKRLGLATSVVDMDEHKAVQVIYEVTNEMLASLRNTVNYFTNVHPEAPVQSIVVTGGGAALPGFLNALADVTRLPVALGDPLANLTVGKGLDQGQLAAARSSISVAVGLALGSAA